MPIKFDKELSTHLFKFVRNIDIHFNPFDGRTRSARELLRQVQATRFAKANPKLQIQVNVHGRVDAPIAHFQFVDGSEQTFETASNHANEMVFEIHLKATQLDAEYELAGKSIDE